MAEQRKTSEIRQVELTDAALHIIATRGVTALSTRSLAAQVGLSSGAIFRHFASIDALLDAVVGRVEAVLDSTYPPPDLPPRERLERFVRGRSEAVGSSVGILRLVLSEQFLLALPESASARLSACVQKTVDFIGGCIREGQNAGELRSDVDAEALKLIIMGTVQMLALSATSLRKQAVDAGVVRGALVTLLAPPGAMSPVTTRRSK